MNSNAENLLRNLTEELKLVYSSQDWGIENASPKRVLEFMKYYEGHIDLDSTLKFQMGELIFASFNDALVDGLSSDDIEIKFVEFIHTNIKDQDFHLRYWSSLDSEEFPIGSFLRSRFSPCRSPLINPGEKPAKIG